MEVPDFSGNGINSISHHRVTKSQSSFCSFCQISVALMYPSAICTAPQMHRLLSSRPIGWEHSPLTNMSHSTICTSGAFTRDRTCSRSHPQLISLMQDVLSAYVQLLCRRCASPVRLSVKVIVITILGA